MARPRREPPDGDLDRAAICHRLHWLSVLTRGSRVMRIDATGDDPFARAPVPAHLATIAQAASQPDNRRPTIATAEYAAALDELLTWLRDHGHERIADRLPSSPVPTRDPRTP